MKTEKEVIKDAIREVEEFCYSQEIEWNDTVKTLVEDGITHYRYGVKNDIGLAIVVKPKGTLPCIQRCSVCHTIMLNHVGSTPCCAGFAEYLYEDEVEALGFVVDLTRNKGAVRPVEG